MKSMLILVLLSFMFTACKMPLVALCEPSPQGCRIVEVYDDMLTCQFVLIDRNGKDNARGNYECGSLE